MNTLDYKGADSTRLKLLKQSVAMTTGFFAVFSVGFILGQVSESAWHAVMMVWATTVNVGMLGYKASEVGAKFAAAKAVTGEG